MARAFRRTLGRLVHRTVPANFVRGFGGLLVAVGVALPWAVAGVGGWSPAAEPEGNKQYKDDIPTVEDLPGDSFGSPNVWADLAADGDPWATAVLRTLNGMKVGVYGAQKSAGVFKFQLAICAQRSTALERRFVASRLPKLRHDAA